MRKWLVTGLLFGSIAVMTQGCILIAAAGAGYLVHDEATECDDKFDPLEDIRDKEDGCN